VPQRGSNYGVELPTQLPKDEFLLKDLEQLGWIKTQALELPHLSAADVTAQAKLMADHPEWGSSSICLTAAFTPGSVSLSAHCLTVPGFEWGRKNQDTSLNPPVSHVYVYLQYPHVGAGFQFQYVGASSTLAIRSYSWYDSRA
jgi:pre-mRNA-processing factor 8